MRVRFQVTVSSDDDSVVKAVNSELQLATGLDGVDPSIAKQDFLTQAENLVRTIAESQLPALYQGVSDAHAAKKAEEADEAARSGAAARVREKAQALKNKKAKRDANAAAAAAGQEAAQEAAHTDQEPGANAIKCTDCGAKIDGAEGHYVTIVRNGKFDRDAVLCDACYDKIAEAQRAQSGRPLEANDGGTRPEAEEGEAEAEQ